MNTGKHFESGLIAICNIVSKDIDDFITTVNSYCHTMIVNNFETGDITYYPTTRELNAMLKDTPENKKNWEKIYDSIPGPFMLRTARVEKMAGIIDFPTDTGIYVWNALKSDEAKEITKYCKSKK